MKEALKLDRTPIKGRPMFISKCDSNKNTRSSVFKYRSTLEKNKLFVKGTICLSTNHIRTTITELFFSVFFCAIFLRLVIYFQIL